MTYVVSNLYGRLDKFEKLVKKINLKESDVLYVLGNIVDYGEDSIELVNELSVQYNVYSILGEHDYKAYLLLSEFDRIIKEGGAPSVSFSKEMIAWAQDGGQATLEAFKSADADGFCLDAADTFAFALLFLRAYTTANGRKKVCGGDDLVCFLEFAFGNLRDEFGNSYADGTT